MKTRNMKPLVTCILGLFILIFTGCKKHHDPEIDVTTIKVAGLFSVNENLSFLGKSSVAAVQIAVDKINADFKQRGIPYAFEFTSYNTNANPSDALTAMQTIANSGCKLVIGPQTSAELSAIKSIADNNGILVVSPSSTASSLSIPDDMIFRFSPGESTTGHAMSQFYKSQGKQALILISRNDIGSNGVKSAIAANFTAEGGSIVNAGDYAVGETDFSVILNQVKQGIIGLSNSFDVSQIGVSTMSWDETTLLFHQAANDTILSSVNWYGGIGYFKPQSLLLDPIAAAFAATTQFSSPEFSLSMDTESLWQPVLDEILQTAGVEGNTLTLCSYDIMMCLGKMIETNNYLPQNGPALAAAFFNSAQNTQGVTGTILLDDNGDRANGMFDFWGILSNSGTFSWQFIGQYE
jgi:branched-chain amino acid transport system substrate-binding protein